MDKPPPSSDKHIATEAMVTHEGGEVKGVPGHKYQNINKHSSLLLKWEITHLTGERES